MAKFLRPNRKYLLVRFNAEVNLADYAETDEQRREMYPMFFKTARQLQKAGYGVYGTISNFIVAHEDYVMDEEGYTETNIQEIKYDIQSIFNANEIYDVDVEVEVL